MKSRSVQNAPLPWGITWEPSVPPRRKRKKHKAWLVLGIVFAAIAVFVLAVNLINHVHRGNMERYIDGYGKVAYESQLVPQVDERGNYFFTTDGDFKVMQLTDVHLGGGFLFSGGDKKAIHAVAAMVEAEKPDLVIVTGDISFAVPWSGTLNNAIAHGYFKRLMENLGVYWTVTFGNHDSEKYNFHNRAAVARMYEDETLAYCLFSAGPEEVFGECNHVIRAENSLGLTTSAFVMIDSNAYTEKDVLGIGWDYDNVHADQIAWYEENIEYYTAKNLAAYEAIEESARPADFDTSAIRSYMYMHIPPEEMRIAYNEEAKGDISDIAQYGIAGEDGKVVYSSEYPDALFETVVALGSTKGIFFGHDHLNSLHLTHEGVLLAYGYSIDYSAYAGGTGYQRGCTLLTLSPDGEAKLSYENYYSERYDHLDDEVDMTLPQRYR